MVDKNLMDFKSPVQFERRFRSLCMGLLALLVAHTAFGQNDTSMPAIPDYYQEAGLSRTKGYENQAVNEAIDMFSGKLQYHFTDVFIPGNGGLDLAVQRSYNAIDDPLSTTALWPQEFSPAGLGWTMHFGRVIRGANLGICSTWAVSGKNPVLEMPDGQRRVLYEHDLTSPTMWITKDFWRASCATVGLNVDSPDGTRYEMTTLGHSFLIAGTTLNTYYTTRIVDRNGNTMNLSYTTVNGVTAVSAITTGDGRSVTFSYNSLGISSVTNGSRTWNYTMAAGAGGRNYLTQVTRPDGLSWKFSYRSSSPGTGSMSRIEYPSGGTIDYSYGDVNFRIGALPPNPSTVVVRKEASAGIASTSPVGIWNYSYAPATTNLPWVDNNNGTISYYFAIPPVGSAPNGVAYSPNQLDITTVEGPEAGRTVKYYHLGARSVSFGTAGSGRAIGRLAGKTSAKEHHQYGYQDVKISNQFDATASLSGLVNGQTYASVLKTEFVGRDPTIDNAYPESYTTSKSGFDVWGNPSLITETGFGGATGFGTQTRTTALTYDINTSKWLIRQVSGKAVTINGQTHNTTRIYDSSNGNVSSETVAGVPTTFNYFASGDLQSRTDALGRVTSFNNYMRGIPQTETQPGGVSVSRVVDTYGNVTSETNGRGFATSFTYDGLNRVKTITPPVGNPVGVDYGAQSKTVSRGGMVSLQTFDGLGRMVRQEASATGETTVAIDYRYDARGRRVFQSQPNSSLGVTYSYDDLDRVIEAAHPTLDSQAYSVFTSYSGMKTQIRDSAERGLVLLHRGFGDPKELQVMESRQGRSQIDGQFSSTYRVMFQRNVLGQLTSVVKGKSFSNVGGWTRSYGYDDHFYLTSIADPEVGTTVYTRDLVGNMTSKQVGAQPAIVYGIDARNRVGSITYSASEDPLVPQAPNVVNTYLNTDVISSITSGGVVRSYTYDEADKITSETLVADANKTYSLTYGYNANEAMSSITYPSGSVVSFNPDGFGRPRAAAPYVNSVDYHPNGMPQLITYANGVTSGMGLNDRLWPSSLNVSRSGTGIVQNAYSYDLVGNLTDVFDGIDSSFDRVYGYDYANRLYYEASYSGGAVQYLYDAVGNITSVQQEYWLNGASTWLPFKTYTYDGSVGAPTGTGRLLGVDDDVNPKTFTYDLSGNVKSNGSSIGFGYDRANNMRCSGCGGASQSLHVYDGTNMRVKTTEGGVTTYSLYDHRGLLLQTEKPGVERKEYVYLGRRQVAERKVPLN